MRVIASILIMSEQDGGLRSISGRIRGRLLVNALIDPAEAATVLPLGLRPHVLDGATIAGCCLLELDHVRPSWVPRALGVSTRAAAHRISVEWGDADALTVGVYVPVRHTDSRLAVLAGGRLFPGVHRRAGIDLARNDGSIRWCVQVPGSAGFGLEVVATEGDSSTTGRDSVGRACIDATLGLSPGPDGRLECVEMAPAHRLARPVDVESLDSGFLASFASATPAASYLMTDVDVAWSPARSSAAESVVAA